jgi:16S rRNA G966 N2-methylase RsmD
MFGLNFGHVEAIEIDKDNFEALKNNVKVFKLKNVTLHQGDATKLFRWKTDILYVDPPWGGPDYKEKQNLDLYLGKERLDEFISLILQQEWRPHYVFIKLPRNYAFERLQNLPNVVKEHKFAIRGFFLVGLEVE